MAEFTFVAHLPLLRIEPPSVSFDGLTLWRMPWEVFDQLTLGAFSDHRAAYEATAPVFLKLDGEIEVGGVVRAVKSKVNGSIDLKVPSYNWHMLESEGLGMMLRYYNNVVEPVRTALALAAPASLLPAPRVSVCFMQLDAQHAFVISDGQEPKGTARVQGEADLEMIFSPACACVPLDAAALQRMVELRELVKHVAAEPDLAFALRGLLGAGAPVLSLEDQATLCSVTLEALLLPEVRSELAETFAGRVGRLLGGDDEDTRVLERTAALLYDARSASLHGSATTPEAAAAIAVAYPAQLLAAAIVELAKRCAGGSSLDAVRSSLDAAPMGAMQRAAHAASSTHDGLRAEQRLTPPVRHHPTIVVSGTDTVVGPEDMATLFAPLVGLGCASNDTLWVAGGDGPSIIALSPSQVLSLEHRDMQRDFAARLHSDEVSIATLCIVIADPDELSDGHRTFERLRRLRNTATGALRLAGIEDFIDPELLGTYVMKGHRPQREPTILRQTVLERMRHAPGLTLTAADAKRTAPAWRLVAEYSVSPRHVEIERAFRLFRRVHDGDFLPTFVRAMLLFALVESLLGRFRKLGDPLPLELLVARVLGDPAHPAARWFAAEARDWRNALAHGRAGGTDDDPQRAAHLRAVARAALWQAMRGWLDAKQPQARPGRLLIKRMSG
jgi:hypothetical protein